MRSLIDIVDMSVAELDDLIATACDIIDNPDKYREACKYKKLATLFFEPSTRTRLSFEAAMLELGGSVIGFYAANNYFDEVARPNIHTSHLSVLLIKALLEQEKRYA